MTFRAGNGVRGRWLVQSVSAAPGGCVALTTATNLAAPLAPGHPVSVLLTAEQCYDLELALTEMRLAAIQREAEKAQGVLL